MSTTDPKPLGTTFEDVFDGLAAEALQILYDRQRKYGPENIRTLGLYGVFTRLEDKMARLKHAFMGRMVHGVLEVEEVNETDDETLDDSDFDGANYHLIRIALRRGLWGFPLREDTDEVAVLAADHPEGVPQLEMTPEEEEAERARMALAGEDPLQPGLNQIDFGDLAPLGDGS